MAIWTGEWDDCNSEPIYYLQLERLTVPADFWTWFPIGPAGARTLLLFIPSLLIYVLRVAQWHVGQRNTESGSETFRKYALRKTTFITISFYAFSAWFYGEVYIFSRAPKARLGFTEVGKSYERIKLNERPVYLRCLFISLALIQSILHLWRDYDKIQIPLMRPKKEHRGEGAPTTSKLPSPPRQVLVQRLKPMIRHASIITGATFVIGTAIYFLGLRQVVWSWYYWFGKRVIALAKTSKPSGLPPFMSLALMFGSQGTLLALLWQFTITAFDLYITQEPLKKNKPITSDSKDPNGSLLNGLKSKKVDVKVCTPGNRDRSQSSDCFAGDRFLGTSSHHRPLRRPAENYIWRIRAQKSANIQASERYMLS